MCLISCSSSIFGAIIVHGDDAEFPKAFTAKINTQAFDPLSGMFFVGLQPNEPNPTYALSRATRPNFNRIEMFTPIGQDAALKGLQIDLLTIAPQPNSAPLLPLVIDGEIVVQIATSDGTIVVDSGTINDAGGVAATSGINSIASSSSTVFAAVSPNAGTFLDSDSGIAVLKIVTVDNLLNSLQTKDATTGLDGNLAAPLNVSSAEITAGTAPTTAQNDTVSLYYDSVLDRLYIGVQVESGAVAGNVANSVVVGHLTSANILNFYSSAPASTLNNGDNGIVITKNDGSTQFFVTSFEPKVMHASTGPDYLIVNGGPDEQTNVGNEVYALPLVNNPSSPATHGTLANKNSALTNGVFTTPAANPGDLPVTSDSAAEVGAGPLPTTNSDIVIADIQVYGDTVYVALNETPDSTTDTGLFSSQALFDATGKIIRWTPWQFHLVPLNAFPNSTLPGGATDDGGIKFFAIDQQSDNIWLVEGTTDQTVGVTNWNTSFTSTDMIESLNNALSTGAYGVLDLPWHTNGFAGSTNYRYALFGGNGVVTFIVTSQLNGSQEIPTMDFSSATNILNSPIPGTARVLEYSRQPTGSNTNYFFAGTEQGFFVFTDSAGNGFDVNTLSALNSTPFSTRSWYPITTITGEPISIKSSGNGNLYVLTRTLTTNPLKPFANTLYSIPFAATTGAMFAPGNIRTIAQTSVGSFANTIQFFDIAIIATGSSGSPATKEQLVLATNQGLYYSNADQTGANNGIINATDQTTAAWTVDATTATTMFHKIQIPNTPIQNTVWPLSMQDASGVQTFDNGSINQFSGSGNTGGTATAFNNGFIPTNFNYNGQANFSFFDLLEGFWTDGARRIVTTKSSNNPSNVNRLSSSPLNLSLSELSKPLLLNNAIIDGVNHFYWLAQIGATGQLVAGTDKGVIALS